MRVRPIIARPAASRRAFAGALLMAMTPGSSGQASEAGAVASCPGSPAQGVPGERLGAEQPLLLLDENFPDPFIARFEHGYYAYGTGTRIGGVQHNVALIRSSNLTQWTAPVEALPSANLPAWVDRDHAQVWAPEAMAVGGRYVLYFNARHATLTRTETTPEGSRILQRHCLGAAVGDTAQGPFVGLDEPLVCAELGDGAIDASPFRDGESLYLLYKDDGNCCGRGSAIYAQGLSPDGLAAIGPRHRLLANNDSPEADDDWEWRVVEAPTMVEREGVYYLFYSGNFFGNKNYSVGYVRCATPRGPCSDPGDNPILWSHEGSPLIGPGHQTVLEQDGRSYIFFHGWNRDPDGNERPGVHKRCLYVSRLHWDRPQPRGEEQPRIVGGAPASRR